MKVVSWNIDCKAEQNGVWSDIINEIDPDLALLQECRIPKINFEEDSSIMLNTIGGTRNWGSCIYSKRNKIKELDIDPLYRGWVALGEVATSLGPILIVSLHAKLAGVKYVVPYLTELLGSIRQLIGRYQYAIVAGDLNAARLYDEIYRHPKYAKHQLLFDFIEKELGLVDCHFIRHGKEIQTMRGKSKHPYQNDHIFVSKPLSEMATSCEVLSNDKILTLSDHNPVIAEFA